MGLTSSCEKERDTTQDRNWRFYRNEIKSDFWYGYTIEEMLQWERNYSKLESKHDYIQWLFPIPGSRGMNSSAQPLFEEEAKAIRIDVLAGERVLAAYIMMLDFYGMSLQCEITGDVRRSRKFQERYDNLNRSTHNFRRITRILISLGELGFERFQVPWVTFLMQEVFVTKLLPKLNGGCMTHWIDAIKDAGERSLMYKNYANLNNWQPDSFAHKTKGNDTASNCIPTKVDEHVHTLANAGVSFSNGNSAGESTDNAKEDNKCIDLNTANNANLSIIPIKNEMVGQSGHNHSAKSKNN